MIRLAVRCAPDLAEQVLAELVVLAPGGVEESEGTDPGGQAWVEYAIYGPPGEVPDLPDLQAAAGDALIEVRTSEVDDDWAERWRQFHKPIGVGGRILVRPPWEPARPEGPEIDIVVDPGQAFGTGAHATTTMCLELLLGLAERGAGGEVADLGTGSGVLAIAAAKLGFGPILGCDHAPESIEAAAENARVNGVEIEVRQVDLRREAAPPAPIWLANLTAPLLREVIALMPVEGSGPAQMILSGMLEEEADPIAGLLGDRGFERVDRLDRAGWAALHLRRP